MESTKRTPTRPAGASRTAWLLAIAALILLALGGCTGQSGAPSASQDQDGASTAQAVSAETGSETSQQGASDDATAQEPAAETEGAAGEGAASAAQDVAAAGDEAAANSSTASSASASATSASSSSSSTSSSSASASAASSNAAAITFIASPQLLSPNQASEQAADPNASEADEVFGYTGGYGAALTADGVLQEAYGLVTESAEPDQSAALACNGGTFIAAEGKLVKVGDATDTDTARAYGTNATATAVNAGSNLVLGSMTAESAALAAPGVFATDAAGAYANDVTVFTAGDYSGALRASYGALVLANQVSYESQGTNSPAVYASGEGSGISIANSTIATQGTFSPVFRGSGRLEANSVQGTVDKSGLAVITDQGTLLLTGSRLNSTMEDNAQEGYAPFAIMMYHPSDTYAPDSDQSASFQAMDCALGSTIQSGSFFYLTNTRSNVLLRNTQLDFDEDKVKLLLAEGDNSHEWGTSGHNGATGGFTAQQQKLKGDIEVDSLSSVEVFLTEQSQWTGASSIRSNTSGTANSENLIVSIDSTSAWVVTEDSTVTTINLAEGGRLVDPKGKSVKLVDSNGFTLVDGASDIEITVNGSFSTTVNKSRAVAVQEPVIDRSPFDATFGVETAFTSTGSSALTEEEQRVIAAVEAVRAWFAKL